LSTRIARRLPVMRKEPRQARSRATVEMIVQAGARILGDEGWAGFTTNKVADLAGVSIGSLYQYFPDKRSLVDAIRHRHLDDCLAVMQKSQTAGLSPVQFVASLVRGMIAAHSIYPRLHRVLLDEAPSSDDYRNPNSKFEVEYLAYYAAAVSTYRKRRPNMADQTAALVISDAIDGVIHNAARRGALGDPAIQNELIRLVSLYLADGNKTIIARRGSPPDPDFCAATS
jgi:AcrR family transcriptional regulator